MSLQYIVDAYNLVNHPQFKPAREAVNIVSSLVNFIKLNQLIGSKNNKGVLVFDGYPPPFGQVPQEDGIVCVFSYQLQADESIKRMVEASASPKSIIVVSDDKQVQMISRLLHAQILGVEEFICKKNRNKLLSAADSDSAEIKLTYSAMHKINAELKKKWLEERG